MADKKQGKGSKAKQGPAADPQPAVGQPGPGSNGPEQVQLMVHGQYIKDLSFENPGAPETLAQMTDPPEVDINVNVDARPLAGNEYEVLLTINAEAKNGDTTVFVAELVYAGVFGLGPTVSEEHKGPILLIECPRLLFPFARNVLADATREGGFPPLLLQPMDFMSIYQQQVAQQGLQV